MVYTSPTNHHSEIKNKIITNKKPQKHTTNTRTPPTGHNYGGGFILQ